MEVCIFISGKRMVVWVYLEGRRCVIQSVGGTFPFDGYIIAQVDLRFPKKFCRCPGGRTAKYRH